MASSPAAFLRGAFPEAALRVASFPVAFLEAVLRVASFPVAFLEAALRVASFPVASFLEAVPPVASFLEAVRLVASIPAALHLEAFLQVASYPAVDHPVASPEEVRPAASFLVVVHQHAFPLGGFAWAAGPARPARRVPHPPVLPGARENPGRLARPPNQGGPSEEGLAVRMQAVL